MPCRLARTESKNIQQLVDSSYKFTGFSPLITACVYASLFHMSACRHRFRVPEDVILHLLFCVGWNRRSLCESYEVFH